MYHVRFVSLYSCMLTVRWQSHKNVLLRLKAWHTELDTYTQYNTYYYSTQTMSPYAQGR